MVRKFAASGTIKKILRFPLGMATRPVNRDFEAFSMDVFLDFPVLARYQKSITF